MTDAFKAHEEGRYALSVPVFLSQMDGICHDIVGAFLFTNHGGKKLYHVLADMPAGSIVTVLLSPVRDGTRFVRGKVLHRDNILHGSDTDYSTEANSLKCIMLLGYLQGWLNRNKDNAASRKAFLAELQIYMDHPHGKLGVDKVPREVIR